MAKNKVVAINVFDDEVFSVSGKLPDGPSTMVELYYGSYDADGKFDKPVATLFVNYQPTDKNGVEVGDPKLSNYGIGDLDTAIELVNPIAGQKGRFSGFRIAEGSEHAKLFGFSDFAFWIKHLKAAAKLNPELVDMDEAGFDITVLDGTRVETVQFTKPAKKKVASDDDKAEAGADKKKSDWTFPVITELIDSKAKKGGKAAPNGKKAVEEDDDEVPAKAPKSKAKKAELTDDENENCQLFLTERLNDESVGESPVGLRTGIAAWAVKKGMDEDAARDLQAHFKSSLAAQLKTQGWKIEKGLLAQDE